MRVGRIALSVVALVAALAAPASPAHADVRTCLLDPVSGLLRCTLVASPAPPMERRLGTGLPLVWRRIPVDVGELVARGHGCTREVGDVTEIGAGYAVVLLNIDTQEVLSLEYVCVWPGDPPPQPPPPPPSPGELRNANARVLTLRPSTSPSPDIGGLTGLESWLWCVDPGEVGVAVALRGWTASGQVSLVYVTWDVFGPSPMNASSTSCGSEEAPSVTWTPEAMGDHSIVLTSSWAGSWSLWWNGISMGTLPLGPISLSAPDRPYPVDEYRGELTS